MTLLPRTRRPGRGRRAAILLVAVMTFGLATAAPASAAEGEIDYVQRVKDQIQVLYSLPGAAEAPDLSTVKVSLNDVPQEATAQVAAESGAALRRTTILAIDVSNSMRQNNRFEEAKAAARGFLEEAPKDLYVGIVTFAGDVEVAQPPSLDRAASAKVLDSLSLSVQTRLYDGVLEAIDASGAEGARSILVLSDGRDTSRTPIKDVIARIDATKTKVDVVALQNSEEDRAFLEQLSNAGNGTVINADDPKALTQVFAAEAESLAKQVLVTITPSDQSVKEGNLTVTVDAGGQTYSDTAYVTVAAPVKPAAPTPSTKLVPVDESGFKVSRPMMLGGLAAAFVGLLMLLLFVFGVFSGDKKDTVEDRIAAYTRKGARKLQQQQQQQAQGVAAQAVGIAEKALESQESLASALDNKLEAAGMSLKPAEWLLVHFGITFLIGLIALLLSGGNIIFALVGLVVGGVLPWAYLSFKRSRRVKAFKYGLADTLQLMSGSLSAGLSLAQSVDTVVREGQDPIAGEFRRALVETRLGVELEDAMSAVAERMESVDFEWVVMAIRIQREVGGNLAELLNNVAATIREREYLERQVLSLSAEGRLSVWILGGLPPGFMAYLLVSNRAYLHPLVSTPIGFVLLGVMAVLLVVGILWMKKLVKVDV